MSDILRTDTTHDKNGSNTHPQYQRMMNWCETIGRLNFNVGLWDFMIDSYAGERTIKSRGTDYLPKTGGMASVEGVFIPPSIGDNVTPEMIYASQQNAVSAASYDNYLMRACYPEILGQIVEAMKGLLSAAPVNVELPGVLEDMIANATVDGRSMDMLAQDIWTAQLTTGRIGLLLDPQEGQGIVAPRIATYSEKAILNWGEDENKQLTWICLDESGYVCNAKTGVYQWKESYRICALERLQTEEGDFVYGNYYTYTMENFSNFDLTVVPDDAIYPEINGQVIDFIPFQVINSCDISNDCDVPILLAVANIALAIYRNSADYELALYMTAQPTTVITGAQAADNIMLGANRVLRVTNPDARVYFHEISGAGIEKQRQAMLDKVQSAMKYGVELIENGAESGTALNTRMTIKTASLMNVALACEAGMKRLLGMAAIWCGYDPDEIVFGVNKDFRNDALLPLDLAQLASLIGMGKFTDRDFHKALLEGKWTDEKDFETWKSDAEEGKAQMVTYQGLQDIAGVEDGEA